MNAVSSPPSDNAAAVVHDVHTVLRDLNWEFLLEWSATIASLWRSAEEAAFRGDVVAFSVHLRQARLATYTVTQALEKAFGRDGNA